MGPAQGASTRDKGSGAPFHCSKIAAKSFLSAAHRNVAVRYPMQCRKRVFSCGRTVTLGLLLGPFGPVALVCYTICRSEKHRLEVESRPRPPTPLPAIVAEGRGGWGGHSCRGGDSGRQERGPYALGTRRQGDRESEAAPGRPREVGGEGRGPFQGALRKATAAFGRTGAPRECPPPPHMQASMRPRRSELRKAFRRGR